ncbi:MAG: CaiB/BaiF CoA-transferase family protein [Burkholderiales bacterium]
MTAASGPLRGLRVLELGHYVSVPYCTRMLADLGAEVIKVEAPAVGDPMRTSGKLVNGRALWWSSLARNKKLVTLDLRSPAGQALALQLVRHCDVVIENFRAGQLEKWHLGWDNLQQVNPRVSLVRVSGFGQTGPYSDRVAFAAIAESTGGLTYVTGAEPNAQPVRPSLSLGDSITGLNAFGMLMAALYERDSGGTGRGRCIDIAMYESVFAMMDGAITEYGALGEVREPAAGTAVFSPSGSFRSRDGRWILLTASGNAVFHRLAGAMGLPELITDPRFLENADRVTHRDALAGHIRTWAAAHDAAEIEALLNRASVPASGIYSIADCAADAHYAARGTVLRVDDPFFGPVLHPPIAARFTDDGSQPGVRWAGADLGRHNDEVYGELLGMAADQLAALRAAGTI